MTKVLIVSGAGAYSDPWHPFPDTTEALLGILSARYEVTVTTDVADALTTLDAGEWDLVVLNFGSAAKEVPTDAACVDGVSGYLAAGGALLASHVVATAFPADPRWEDILGGRWVRGTTMHPPKSDARIAILAAEHPVLRGIADFTLRDERYSYLRVADDSVILATHEHDSLVHPVIWTHEWAAARVVYDGLGHDAQSYQSAEHRTLLLNAAEWLVAPSDGRGPTDDS